MAHFAQLNEDSIVMQVIVVHNNELLDENNQESEEKGAAFCQNLFGGTWLQTSYNGSIRKNYAAKGYFYNQALDAFVPPKPFPSWVLNEESCQWDAPTQKPQDDKIYNWDEPTTSWIEVTA